MPKLTPLQICLGISILCHVMAFGGYELLRSGAHAPALQQTDDVVTLTLVAAPDEAATPAIPMVKVVAPVAPPEKSPEKVAPLEPVQPPRPAPQAELVLPAPTPVVTAVASPPVEVLQGDASSPKPGPDMVTTQARPSVEARPNYLKNPEPVYPEPARRRHQEGLVMLDVIVTPQGQVAGVKLKKSSGFALLDEAALKTVENWEFEPARLGTLALESEITVPIRFELRARNK